MRKKILLVGALAGVMGSLGVAQVPVPAAANHYRNLNVAVYARAQEVDKMNDAQWLQQSWDVHLPLRQGQQDLSGEPS